MAEPTENIAHAYNRFQDDFGSGKEQNYNELIESLFTENFRKVINGDIYVAERSGLLKQLTDLRQAVGGWSVEVINIASIPESYNYTSEWRIHTRDAGVYHAVAILGSTDGIKINSVHESAYKVE